MFLSLEGVVVNLLSFRRRFLNNLFFSMEGVATSFFLFGRGGHLPTSIWEGMANYQFFYLEGLAAQCLQSGKE